MPNPKMPRKPLNGHHKNVEKPRKSYKEQINTKGFRETDLGKDLWRLES